MTIGQKISMRRKQLGLTLEEVGHAAGVAKSTVLKWEKDFISNMRIDKIEGLAKILETSKEYLLADDDNFYLYDNIEPMPDMHRVPLLGAIACGVPTLAEENFESFVEVDNRINADFALRCVGDSMVDARIFDGDIVFVRKQNDVDNGEIAAVVINDEATLKRVYKYKSRIVFRAENPLFEDLEFDFDNPALEQVWIIGKAVSFLSRL